MRSVPIIIDKTIRHLRYSFGAIEDVDALLPGGFDSVFKREADIGMTHLLLFEGLKHEGITYDEVGFYLINSNAIRDPKILESIWKKIIYAFVNDKWIDPDEDKNESTKDIKITSLADAILGVENLAIQHSILPHELYALTPREFSLIRDYYGLKDNFRAGLICATTANVHVSKKGGDPFLPNDFIRVSDPEPPQSVDDQSEILAQVFGG
jgi:hypothetical protein